MSTTDMVWQDPPAEGVPNRNVYNAFRATLRDNPGAWALLPLGSRSPGWAYAARKASVWAGFEVTTRNAGQTNRFDVYVRYVGEQSP